MEARRGTLNDDAVIDRLLATPGVWAVVGWSDRADRPSHRVAEVLCRRGHRVIPVNPNCPGSSCRDVESVPELAAIGEPIDVVDVFRRSSAVAEVVDQAIAVGARAIWMQLGVIDADAAQRAMEAGIDVVMDRCPAIEYRRRDELLGREVR